MDTIAPKTYKTIWLAVLVVMLIGGAVCYCWNSFTEKEVSGNISSEIGEEFYDAYTEVVSSVGQDNTLIVVSDEEPNGYGARDIIKGLAQTYYLVYDSVEQRDAAYTALLQDDTISVEKNGEMEILRYNSWGVGAMGIDKGLSGMGENGQDVKVAVIDTGLDVDLFRSYYPSKSLSVYDIGTNSESLDDMSDTVGHGTHIAGVVGEGTADCTELMIIKVERNGKVMVSDVNTAIYKAIDSGVDVINLSLGSNDYYESQKRAIDAAMSEGIVVVAAAGNENGSTIMYPAGYDNTISVAALDGNFQRAVWNIEKNEGSNYNEMVDYAAPGTMIQSINGYASGTSMAAPHVTAAVALIKNYNNTLGLGEVNTLLRRHVIDLGEEGRDDYYGYGMIDFNEAEFCENTYCDEYGVFAAEMSVQDMTHGVANIEVLADGLKVSADEACMVVISVDNGETYAQVPAIALAGESGSYKFEFEKTDGMEVMVLLKGDGDMDGAITPADLNIINRSLISPTLGSRYRALTNLEKVIFDLDGDEIVTPADLNTFNRALISPTLRPYKAIEW